MEITLGGAALVGAGVGLAAVYRGLEPYEMGVFTVFGHELWTTGPGPKFPVPPFKLWTFPRVQIPLILRVPVNTIEGAQAIYYSRNGRELKFSNLSRERQMAIINDPLSRQLTISVEVAVLFEFKREELYGFITKFHTPEKFGEQFGFTVLSALRDIFGQVTVGTALERKKALSTAFGENITGVLNKPGNKWLGISLNDCLITHVELGEEIERVQLDVAKAFAEKKQMIAIAEGHKAEKVLSGEGQGEYYGAVGKYLETDGGKFAAGLDITKAIYGGVSKIMYGPDIAATIAGGVDLISMFTKKSTPAK